MKRIGCLIIVLGFVMTGFSQKEKDQKSSLVIEPGKKTFIVRQPRSFTDSLGLLVGKLTTKNFSGDEAFRKTKIAFIEYDPFLKRVSVVKTENGQFRCAVEAAIQDDKVLRLVKDSAKTAFILPFIWMVDNDDMKELDMNDLIIPWRTLDSVFSLLKDNNRKNILNPIRVSSGTGRRI